MKVWQVRELFGSSDIILISCFATACLDIIKIEKCFLFFFWGIKYLTGRQNFCEQCCPVFSSGPM